MAFSAQGWQRCLLRSPPPDAIFPLVGEMAQCRHGPTICDNVPRHCRHGPSSTASGGGGSGGEARVFTYLEVWAPNMYAAEAEPLPPAAFHPPPPCGLRTCRTPPPRSVTGGAGGSYGKSGVASSTGTAPLPPLHPPYALHPPEPKENLVPLLSTLVTVPGPRRGGGSVEFALVGCNPLLPWEFAPTHWPLGLSSRDANGRADQRGTAQLNGRCSAFKREAGPLEWWAVPCFYRRVRLARR